MGEVKGWGCKRGERGGCRRGVGDMGKWEGWNGGDVGGVEGWECGRGRGRVG